MADTLESLAGTMPDGQVAERLAVDVSEVKAWRRKHDVAPYLQAPPEAARAAEGGLPEDGPSVDGPRRREVVRRRANQGAVEAVAYRAPAPPPRVDPAPAPPARRPGRPASSSSKVDAFRDQLGKVADHVVAGLAGVSAGVVGAYRRKHGIVAYDGYLFAPGHAPSPGAGRTPKVKPTTSVSAPRGRKSRIEDFAVLVGVESDAAIAAKASVSRPAVTAWRHRRGLAATPQEPGRKPSARASNLDAYRDRMGKVPDGEVAKLAGVSRDVVGAYRREHDIPAYDGFRSNRARPPVAHQLAPPPAKAVPLPRAVVARNLRAYTVVASADGAQKEFIVVGEDMTDACGRAQHGLAARTDGPWLVDSVRVLGEAFG